MHELHCRRDGVDVVGGDIAELGARIDEQGTDALAATQDRIPHRIEQASWHQIAERQLRLESLLGTCAVDCEPVGK